MSQVCHDICLRIIKFCFYFKSFNLHIVQRHGVSFMFLCDFIMMLRIMFGVDILPKTLNLMNYYDLRLHLIVIIALIVIEMIAIFKY